MNWGRSDNNQLAIVCTIWIAHSRLPLTAVRVPNTRIGRRVRVRDVSGSGFGFVTTRPVARPVAQVVYRLTVRSSVASWRQ